MLEKVKMTQTTHGLKIALLALTGLLVCGTLAAIDPPRERPREFSGRTLDGQRFTSASLRGRTVLIQFWATWCPICRQDQPFVDKLTREFEGKGLVVIAVNVGESRRKVTQYLEKAPRACNIVLAEETNLASIFKPAGYPLYVMLRTDGSIAATQSGSGGEMALRQLLRRAGL